MNYLYYKQNIYFIFKYFYFRKEFNYYENLQ